MPPFAKEFLFHRYAKPEASKFLMKKARKAVDKELLNDHL